MPLNFTEILSEGVFDCSPQAIQVRLERVNDNTLDTARAFTPAIRIFAACDESGQEVFRVTLREVIDFNCYIPLHRNFSTELSINSSNPDPELAKAEIIRFCDSLKTNDRFDYYYTRQDLTDNCYRINLSRLDEVQLEQFWHVLRKQKIFSFKDANDVITQLNDLAYPKFLGEDTYEQIRILLESGQYEEALRVAKEEDKRASNGGNFFNFDYTYLVAQILKEDKDTDLLAMQAFEYLSSCYSQFSYEAREQCALIAIARAATDPNVDLATNRQNALYAIKKCLFSEAALKAGGERRAALALVTSLTGNRADVKQELDRLYDQDFHAQSNAAHEGAFLTENLGAGIIDVLTTVLERDAQAANIGKARKRNNSI